jgi:hypothetical protein
LTGCSTISAEDVERDVRDHIDAEFADTSEQISEDQLESVLHDLGQPDQWVPEEELPSWRRWLKQWRTGPDDWRLAYISLGLFILTWFGAWICLFASFCVSRAVLETMRKDQRISSQRWLLYPSLIVVYVPLAIALIIWPIPSANELLVDNRWRYIAERITWLGTIEVIQAHTVIVLYFIVLSISAWFTMLGFVLRSHPQWLVVIFCPFADWFQRRHATRLMFIGLAGLAICLAALLLTMA